MAIRNVFQGMMHSGRPSDAQLRSQYGLKPLYLTVRTAFAGWTDPQGLPTQAWYDNAAAGLVAPDHWVMIDHESWPNGTQADRLATATKFATVYQGLKTLRPDLQIGFYGFAPKRDLFRSILSVNDASYLAWQAENNDIASILGPVIDIYAPSLYCYHTKAANPSEVLRTGLYVQAQLDEAARVKRLYGRPDVLILPFIWYMRHDQASPLDIEYWEMVLRICLDEDHGNDGAILWAAWGVPWDENAPWWVTIKARLTDKRRTG